MIRKLPILAGLIIASATAGHAQQARNCGPRPVVVEKLSKDYGESRQAVGMATRGRIMEMFASEESGTWTVLVTMPNGVSCLVASGESYESVEEPLLPTGIPG